MNQTEALRFVAGIPLFAKEKGRGLCHGPYSDLHPSHLAGQPENDPREGHQEARW